MIAGGRKTIGFFLAAVMMLSLVAVMLMGALPAQAAGNEIVYIYDTDVASADSYKALLEANGYVVTKVHMDDVATTDFSTYGLIIVGQDTGSGYTWGDAPSVSAIEGSGKPIIGLDSGGMSLFQELGLSINYGHGGFATNQTGINVTDPSRTIFSSPNSIPVPGDGIVALYSSNCTLWNEYGPSLSPDADPLGCTAVYSPSYYPLVQEEQNVLWGFEGSPDSMTQEGEDLFVNVANHLFPLPAPAPGGLSGGAIAGIVIGSCAAAGLIAYFVIRMRRAAGKGA